MCDLESIPNFFTRSLKNSNQPVQHTSCVNTKPITSDSVLCRVFLQHLFAIQLFKRNSKKSVRCALKKQARFN